MGTTERAAGGGHWRGWITVAACVLTGGASVLTARTPIQSLRNLTVPRAALPGGCALEPSEPGEAAPSRLGSPPIRMWSREAFPANPWSGTERKFVAMVRAAIDPSPRVPRPDGQLVKSDAQFLAARAEGVVEAYRAVYVSAEGNRVEVFAVAFNDEALVRAEPVAALTNPPRGMRSRFERDATVAVVSAATPDECTRAVEAHVRSFL